ncbi:hypothetical protein D3C80_845960 [compost metagenome]
MLLKDAPILITPKGIVKPNPELLVLILPALLLKTDPVLPITERLGLLEDELIEADNILVGALSVPLLLANDTPAPVFRL